MVPLYMYRISMRNTDESCFPFVQDDKKARRKQILNNIGEDLLLVSKDQPFRFPATFTFVIRAFTVLDGLGKSLDKKFDISEISRPYARDLLMDGKPPSARVQQAVIKRAIAQSQAFVNLIKVRGAFISAVVKL